MELKKRIKKAVVGVALAGALFTTGCSKENPTEPKGTKAKMEQRADNKSEIKDARKKVGYLDEYLAAIERGEDKEEAYRILTLKMADGNQKAAEEMQKQVKELKRDVDKVGVAVGICLLCWLWGFQKKPELVNIDAKLGKILKSKGIEK